MLESIAAAVVSGASLRGGRGGVMFPIPLRCSQMVTQHPGSCIYGFDPNTISCAHERCLARTISPDQSDKRFWLQFERHSPQDVGACNFYVHMR